MKTSLNWYNNNNGRLVQCQYLPSALYTYTYLTWKSNIYNQLISVRNMYVIHAEHSYLCDYTRRAIEVEWHIE